MTCQCGPEQACGFVRERDEARAQLAEALQVNAELEAQRDREHVRFRATEAQLSEAQRRVEFQADLIQRQTDVIATLTAQLSTLVDAGKPLGAIWDKLRDPLPQGQFSVTVDAMLLCALARALHAPTTPPSQPQTSEGDNG